MSRALYRKYRSKSLAEVVGQNHITSILSNALKSGRIAHAYLLTGPRGVGKTSVARILAHEINSLPYAEESTHLDIIEIDAASNNGVDDVRDLREKVQLAPVSATKKVYIIDEVHMLSKPAFNALLKTLEEPPQHVVFILATTDVQKLPATIISRTQQYGFRSISTQDVIDHLKNIAKLEGIKIDDESLKLIAERGDGSFRDSISLLDQLASLAVDDSGITPELVESTLGLAASKIIKSLLDATEKGDLASIVKVLDESKNSGTNTAVLASQLINAAKSRLSNNPSLLNLLDGLIDIRSSSHPDIKLLSVLGSFNSQPNAATSTVNSVHHPKSAALSAPVLEVSATIEELSKQAVKKRPEAAKAPKKEEVKSAGNSSAKNTESKNINWNSIIEHVKEHYVALYSVLSKCSHEFDGETLTLYTGNAFYKKKLDDPKYSSHLYESLQTIGSFQPNIHTIPTPPPLKDSQAAAIAGIMGGGVEVSLDASI